MSLRPLSKIARLSNLKVSVKKGGESASVAIPSLTVDDIDRTGNINIWRIQKLMTMARMAAYHIPSPDTSETFLEYDKFTSGFFTFMASGETEVSRDFYNLIDDASWPGLDITFHLGHMGSASLNTVATLKNAKTGQEMAWNTNAVVCVDKTTRKPAIIPDWWRIKYSGSVIENKKLLVKKMEVPSEKYEYQVRVQWSDVDAYKHANYLAYVRYCLDSAMDGIQNKAFTKIQGDIYAYHVKKLQVLYIQESLGNELIDVSVWENKEDPLTLHFDMNKGGKSIFQCTMEFYAQK